MTVLVVDFGRLRSAITHMEEFGNHVTECLEDIEQTMAALRESWHGDGSDAQAQAQRRWADGTEQMKEALSALQKIADGARANYSDAVSKNAQMWQA
ncbi:WXG100 family type VII secretion target [Mycolicibacterium chubuense NBB4]|uniref:ESAT-6-like protein n=1 Tax=Mycolicibacterium chubuense (strain NBB4) TaxID=710421 RepID=I4BQT4_MYCCN|nr:WXG100 family type VII secretion target [Mycolicibacterium chubuense]AFM19641.1 WXG100 family type VII secretion target [Mycolicibacterium chubuense NBB4]